VTPDQDHAAITGRSGGHLLSRYNIALLLLLVGTVYQLGHLANRFIWPRAQQYWSLRSYSAWERSALLSEGDDFLEDVSFLREEIPESAKVVVPPHSFVSKAGPYTFVSFMQYFLFPREVLNCGEDVAVCVRGLTGGTSYILRLGEFPPPLAAREHKEYVPFRDEMGVYVPK